MHDTLVTYLLNLADTRPDNKGRFSGLKIYTNRTARAIRKSLNCVSLDRLIEHLVSYGATDADVRSAIGSLNPQAGSGTEPHVIIVPDSWKRQQRNLGLMLRDIQNENRLTYLRAYGASAETELPPLEVTVN